MPGNHVFLVPSCVSQVRSIQPGRCFAYVQDGVRRFAIHRCALRMQVAGAARVLLVASPVQLRDEDEWGGVNGTIGLEPIVVPATSVDRTVAFFHRCWEHGCGVNPEGERLVGVKRVKVKCATFEHHGDLLDIVISPSQLP